MKEKKKKSLLFIEEGLGVGGAEKSLLTLLSMLDYEKYDVDLFLFRHSGTFMSMIPNEVNLINECENFRIFNNNRKLAPFFFLFRLDLKRVFYAIIYLFKALFYNFILKTDYIGWKEISPMFDNLDKEYDVTISYLEGKSFYYAVDKVNSKKKIGFIHIDYNMIPYDYQLDLKYMRDFDFIATVSDHCKEVLISIFPEYHEKFLVIKNMINEKEIIKMAQETIEFNKDSKYIYITTVGRLTYQKGIDNAILICKELVDQGFNIKWYVIGKGSDYEQLSFKIKEYHLQNNFFLLGAKTNPYKYMNLCDIYVQPSRFEGYGITVAEAKCLGKPIVATNIPEFQEQLIHGKTGLLCNSNEEITRMIIELINSKDFVMKLESNLKVQDTSSNIENLNLFYNLLSS